MKNKNRKPKSGFRFVKLSRAMSQKIGNHLHVDLQFYDEHGQPANNEVIGAIERSLIGETK